MSHVIHHKVSFHRIGLPGKSESFATEKQAKATLTRLINSGRVVSGDYKVATYEEWQANDPDVIVFSIFDLKKERPITIKSSEKGCRASDPSMEGYHTM